jgi:sugar/nucleoside kinase (ribokinase family)
MKIAVLGAVCFDEIITLDGNRSNSFGGILYNVAAMSALLRDGESAKPVTMLGADRYNDAIAEFRRFPGIDTSAIGKCASPLTHVTLQWTGASTRHEKILHRMPPFTIDDLSPALECDAAHFNFINGTELDLYTLRAFRAMYKGIISIDIHQLISHFSETGQRTISGFNAWKDWLPYVDVIQGNELEIAHTVGRSLHSRDDFRTAALELCSAGPRMSVVTLGEGGALMVYREGAKYWHAQVPPFQKEKAIETTGCGDSFSSGLLVGLLRYGDSLDAFAAGAIAAGANAQLRGLGNLANVSDYLDSPRDCFPDLRPIAVE